MEGLASSSCKAAGNCFLSPPLSKPPLGFSSTSLFRNGQLSFGPISSGKLLRRSLMVEAKKGNENKNKNKKVDNHSFAPKPDEAGPFPEAVLLKKKKVQEDGKLLPEYADDEEREMLEFLNLQLESDLGVDQMRHYEIVYMIHPDYKEKVDEVNSKVQDFMREKKGRVWRFNDWGMRRLAYKIKKANHAHYILMNFELSTLWINEFKTMLDQDERVIRHLVMKRDKAITEDCPPPPEFHTLQADLTNEYSAEYMEEIEEYDDDEDDEGEYDDEDDEEYDDEDEEYDDEDDEGEEYDDEDDEGEEYDEDERDNKKITMDGKDKKDQTREKESRKSKVVKA